MVEKRNKKTKIVCIMSINCANNSPREIKKRLFTLKPVKKNGLLIKIHHTKLKYSLTQKRNVEQRIRFIISSFDETSKLIASSDLNGNVFIVDLQSEKFWLLPKIESCATLKFCQNDIRDLLIGLANGKVLLINVDTGFKKNEWKDHQQAIKDISFANRLCLISSKVEAIVYNSCTFQKLHVLSLKSTSLKYITFLPGNYILACFEDYFVNVWDSKNFESTKQILPTTWKRKPIKSIAYTKDGKTLLLASHIDFMFEFSLETWEITKTLQIPCIISSVKHINFIPQSDDENNLLAILSNGGILFFYNIESNIVFNQIQENNDISLFSFTPDGSMLSLVLHSGEIMIYKMRHFLSTFETVESPSEGKMKKPLKLNIPIKKQMSIVVDTDKLKTILLEFGEYPSSYRNIIWAKILEVPGNVICYKSLSATKSTYFSNVEKEYPLLNKLALKNMKKLLKTLANWCPFFGHVQFLPLFVFPFVKIFENDPVVCFETVCTILMNWCQHWFEYFPYPPVNILAIIENVFSHHDPQLMSHLRGNGITTRTYAWSLMEVAFSEVLTSQEWCVLWDHVLTNEPSFILMTVVAYNIINRNVLLSFKTFDEFERFYHSQNLIDIKKFVSKTYNLNKSTPDNIHPRQYFDYFVPLSKGEYPTYSGYPQLSSNLLETNDAVTEGTLRKLEKNTELYEKAQGEELHELQVEKEENKRMKMLEDLFKDNISKEMQKVQEKRQLVRKISEKFLNKQTNVPKNKLKIKRKKEVKITDIEMEQKNLQEEHNNLKRDIDKIYKQLKSSQNGKKTGKKFGKDKISSFETSTRELEKQVETLLSNWAENKKRSEPPSAPEKHATISKLKKNEQKVQKNATKN